MSPPLVSDDVAGGKSEQRIVRTGRHARQEWEQVVGGEVARAICAVQVLLQRLGLSRPDKDAAKGKPRVREG